jgi:DNA-binding transcriptional LysR family regulator
MQRRIGLKHIEAFRGVCAAGSMTRAAASIHTSQPHVSRLVAQLESTVGFALFYRSGSRLALTAEGARFQTEVDRTLVGLAGLESAAVRIRAFGGTQLRVVATPSLAQGLLARAISQFVHEFPDVLVSMHETDAESVCAWVRSGLCDLGLALLCENPPGLKIRTVSTLQFAAVLPRKHPLGRLSCLRPTDFDGQRFVAFSSGSAVRTLIDSVFASAGTKPTITAEAFAGPAICSLVSEGLGASLVHNPLAVVDSKSCSGLELRPFCPTIASELSLLYPETASGNRLADAFSSGVIQIIRAELDVLPRVADE